MLKVYASVAALLVLGCAGANGQQQQSASPVSRTIEGSVLDRTGKPVGGAIVLIEDLKSLQVRSYVVSQDGKFHFRGLSGDANYQLRARKSGMASKPKTVSVFESKPLIVVNLTLVGSKSKQPKQPRSAPTPGSGNPS